MKLRPGHVAIVTGASQGIGRALVQALAARGVGVVGCARDGGRLVELERELGSCPGRVRLVAADVADPAAGPMLVREAEQGLGGLDLVVNNAGVINEPAPVEQIALEAWREVLETNVIGLVSVCRAAAAALRRRGGGSIVNLSSYWGHVGAADFGPYCASKFAVEGISQVLARELKQSGIVVVAVRPGMVVTRMLAVATRGHPEGHKPADRCAQQLIELVESLRIEDTGRPRDLD
jgi:NAD(P)-dependent dehydrogenase (short-subunit alcohol dehydrogenase family)